MHDDCVVLAREDVSGAPHISSELINFIESAINDFAAIRRFAQIGENEIVGFCFGELGKLEIDTAHPETFSLQVLYEMGSDKAPCPAN